MSFRFVDWRGNHHLCGDINFDGIINLEDYEMINLQLGNTSDLEWGSQSDQYNPNADFDRDGVISNKDLEMLNTVLGKESLWFCWHPNPSMIDSGKGWIPNSIEWQEGELIWGQASWDIKFRNRDVLNELVELYKEQPEKAGWLQPRGFRLWLILWNLDLPCWRWIEVDCTAGHHPAHNPDGAMHPKPEFDMADRPLYPTENHEFLIETEIHEWYLGESWMWDEAGLYLLCGFGGWLLLDEPYDIYVPRPWGTEHYQSKVFELMFAVKRQNTVDEEPIVPGSNEWHSICFRPGYDGDISKGWFIFQHVMCDPEVGQRVCCKLSSDLFSELISKLKDTPIYEKNISNPTSKRVTLLTDSAWIENVNLEDAKFRLAYACLEGGIDHVSPDVQAALEAIVADISHLGVYHYYKGNWKPAFSNVVSVNVS